jgi:hypothetical protein
MAKRLCGLKLAVESETALGNGWVEAAYAHGELAGDESRHDRRQ